MRCLNEYIARRANAEDECKRRFWEGRFKSQALLDEAALLSCMAYVDLNPVRAGLCESLEESDFTSIQARIRRLGTTKPDMRKRPIPGLMPFGPGKDQRERPAALPYQLWEYIELVDWTGRIVRANKQGFIPETALPILSALRLNGAQWRTLTLEIQQEAITVLNGLDKLAARARSKTKRAA